MCEGAKTWSDIVSLQKANRAGVSKPAAPVAAQPQGDMLAGGAYTNARVQAAASGTAAASSDTFSAASSTKRRKTNSGLNL